LVGKKYTHEEACTLLQEAALIIKSRPIARGLWAEGDPLNFEDFMLGRAAAGVTSAKLNRPLAR
jgi:hypothetical protein